MQITLKQTEIEAGVRQYIADQGINLEGKSVTIDFTATRANGGGIMATVDIEKATNLDGPVLAPRPQLVVATPTPVLAAVAETPGVPFEANAPFAVAGNDAELEQPKTGKSLFN